MLKENKPANGCRVNAILAHVKDHYLRQSCILIKQVVQKLFLDHAALVTLRP